MFDDFYLWCNSVLNISAVTMKYIIEKHIKEIVKGGFISENGIYKGIIDDVDNSRQFLSSYEIEDKDRVEIYELLYERIKNDENIKEKVRNKFYDKRYSSKVMINLKHEMKLKKINYITIDSEEYPSSLKEIYDYPYILYYYGDIDLLKSCEHKIAVVGSRKATDYGHNVTRFLVKELSKHGFIIVSGMATGVDSYAHKYCIEERAKTIAVFGTPINKIYPQSNRKLYIDIINSGGLAISEYNFNASTHPSNFAIRNRIISGISDGIIVTEAKKKSGAIITVDCALQQGKNVYSVPGSIFSSMSEGCNDIISEGAKLVRNINDILEDFDIEYNKNSYLNDKYENNFYKNSRKNISTYDNINLDNKKDIEISKEELKIFNILSEKGAINIDDICKFTDYSIKDVNYYLGNLLLMDLIVEQGMNLYAPNIIIK